ncbi:MAG: hypothetical protein AAF950_16040 [Pseudomonadota bacterium]
MQRRPYFVPLVIGIIGAVVSAIWHASFASIELDEVTPEQVGQLFLSLIFVALVIERATEVYLNTSIQPEKELLLTEVKALQMQVRTAREALNIERMAASSNAAMISDREQSLDVAIHQLNSAKSTAAPSLHKLSNKAQKEAAIVTMLLGIIAAIVGIRTLNPFVPDEGFAAFTNVQKSLVAGVDVLLTGALLAGGADALHQIVRRFIKFAGDAEEQLG